MKDGHYSHFFKQAKSRMECACHMERMEVDRLPREAYVHKDKGRRRRPRLRWPDCIRRDITKAEV